MKPIYIDKYTKGILAHAKPTCEEDRTWIILVHSIQEEWNGKKKIFHVTRHISYCVDTNECYINEKPRGWGYLMKHTLCEPTEEDKQIIKNIMKKRKYRFIKILNKLEKVHGKEEDY